MATAAKNEILKDAHTRKTGDHTQCGDPWSYMANVSSCRGDVRAEHFFRAGLYQNEVDLLLQCGRQCTFNSLLQHVVRIRSLELLRLACALSLPQRSDFSNAGYCPFKTKSSMQFNFSGPKSADAHDNVSVVAT